MKCIYVCMCMYVYVCVCMCMYVYICVYMCVFSKVTFPIHYFTICTYINILMTYKIFDMAKVEYA